LEGERNRQKGTIAKQASEIEGLKEAKKKSEDELRRSTDTNEAQRRELGQLKDDNKAMKAKEDRLVEEVGKLEGERNRQEGIIAKQALEIEGLKDDNKGMKAKEDELVEEVGKLKEEIRQRSAQHDSLVKELGELKDLLNKLGVKQFPPSVKKVTVTGVIYPEKRKVEIDVPDGIIAHLTRECGGNVHDRHVVDVTCGSFEKETKGANRHSGAYRNDPDHVIMIPFGLQRM
jgi:predicted RNase H-like nuclease (RuvC/YqgF family)